MKLTLMPRLLLFILLPALIGMACITGFSFFAARDTLTAQIAADMTLVVERQKSELENVTLLLRQAIITATYFPSIQTLLEEKDTDTSFEHQEALTKKVRADLQEIIGHFSQISGMALLDANGKVLVHSNAEMEGTNRSDRGYFKTAINGSLGVQTLYSRGTKNLATIIAEPVKVNGKIVGVLFGEISIPDMSKTTTDTIRIGKTGVCYIYSTDGMLLAHPDKTFVGNDDSKQEWTQQIIKEGNGRIVYERGGLTRIAYFRTIPHMKWIVAVAISREEAFSPVTDMLERNILIVVIAAVVVGLIIFFVARGIAKVMGQGARIVTHVAAGNLELTPEMKRELEVVVKRPDEIGTLARGVGSMVESLCELVKDAKKQTETAKQATLEAQNALQEAEKARNAADAKHEGMLAAAAQLEEMVSIISSASTQLSAQIEQSGRGAEEQAARVTETATAMEEMNSTVLEVAKNAGMASEMSAKTKEKAFEGANVVNKAVDSIRNVQEQSLALRDDMAKLLEQAHAINRIMGVISDIADQTNLLALNAAIEAARAGDAGRGFAVVADEVRKLAEKTMASTHDVGKAIKSIQDSTDQSVRQADLAVNGIDEATALAAQSGAALNEIATMTEETADQVRAIATASEQQSATSEEINRSISQVNTIATETANAMAEASKAISDLATQAQRLNQLIEDMKRG